MLSKRITVNKNIGLFARPAAFFVQLANKFKSTLLLESGSSRINAKSLLGVLSLGIINGSEITLIADGEDEESAVDSLSDFLSRDA